MAAKQLYQNDPRWQNEILGNGTTETIGYFGCLLTCLAMVGNHFSSQSLNVSQLNARLKAMNGFQGPWVRAFKINQVYPGVVYQKHLESNNQPAPLELIDDALASGSLVVVRVDNSPAPGIQGHWVVIHEKAGDDYRIWDPYKKEAPETLQGRFAHGGTAAQIIQEGILFGTGPLTLEETSEGPTAEDAEKTFTSSSTGVTDRAALGALVVQPTVDGLTLRRQPQISSGNIIKYLSRSSKLKVSDDPLRSSTKLGKKNQWLKVKDIEGDEGYVAAWLATLSAEPALGVQSKEQANKPTPPRKVVVKTAVQSVSLRKAPRIAAATLIRYLPLGTELRLQDEADASKIGKKNQWLAVTTVEEQDGYIAAWLVVKV